MDITVAEVEGLPAHTYISVRYGEMRRQVPFRAGEALSFPTSAPLEGLPKAYTVDVFRKVASKQVSLAGITALGGTVRHEDLVIPSLDLQSAPITASLTASLREAKSLPVAEDSKKQLVAARAKQYLERHGVQSVLHEMFAQLLEKSPSDPLAFMIDHLEQKRDELEDQEATPRDFSREAGLGSEPFPGFASGQDLPDLSQHHSIMADVLNRDAAMYGSLRQRNTALGVSLAECVKPGIDCPGHELVKVAGAFAGDGESYELFRDFFDPVIRALHTEWSPEEGFHPCEGDPAKLSNAQVDPAGGCAVFATIEVRRNLRGLRFPPCCSQRERREVERVITKALEDPATGVRGTYYPLQQSRSYAPRMGGMTAHQEEKLRGVGMTFSEPDSRIRLSAGIGRDWPDARGVFVGEAQGLYLWCNEEDHLRFFARQDRTVDLKKLWGRVDGALSLLAKGVGQEGYEFSQSNRLGYLTACPSRLGTTLRVSVSLKIPMLAAATDLTGLCRALDLQCSHEVDSGPHGSIWNISTTDCLGISEVDLINGMIEGCKRLVELEQRLAWGEPIFDAMPGLDSEPYPGFPSDRCPKAMPDLSGNNSLMAAVLLENPGIYDQLRSRKTDMGVGFAACIKPGVDDKGHPRVASAGAVAGDAASYETFQELFTPIIRYLHSSFVPGAPHPVASDLSGLSGTQIDATGSYALSVCVELRRNFHGFRLAPCCTREERREVERLFVQGTSGGLSSDGGGEYLPLAGSESYAPRPGGVSWADQSRLCAEGLMFSEPSAPSRLAAGLGRDWPDARGVFVANRGDLAIWCNEEEHLRLVARGRGGELGTLCGQVLGSAARVEEEMRKGGHGYMRDERLGYLTVDPANLGGGLRCSVTARLPQLSARGDFPALCGALGLHAAWEGGAWELAAGPRLGLSEVDVANAVIEGSAQLVALEHQLQQGCPIEGALAQLGRAAD